MPSIRWYLQRVRAMRPMEIPWRAWRMLRSRAEVARHWPDTQTIDLSQIWSGLCDADSLRRLNPAYPLCPTRNELDAWPLEWRERCLADADAGLAHLADFFHLKGRELGESIDWHRDYASGLRVDVSYSAQLDYRDVTCVGDVKIIWELARMQHLTRLAQAWQWTGDARYAREIVAQITAWIVDNPWMMGINWTSPMECSLRLITWTWAFHLIRDWEGLSDDFVRLLVASIHQHLYTVDRSYSLFSSANNHLIAEASGAYVAAVYWHGLKGSKRWARRARCHLLRECVRQNSSDGVNEEQTFAYQFFVWDLLVLPALYARALAEDFPPSYWHRIERMAEFMAWASDGEGNTPNIGDQDDGVAIHLGGDHNKPLSNMLAVAAGIFGRGDFLSRAGGQVTEQAAWLLPGPFPKPVVGEWTSHAFPEGGYCVVRSNTEAVREFFLLFDVGPNGDAVTGVHGHADALSVILHLGGQPFFVDPGTFSYQDTPLRHYFRATAQHNTLCFGEEDQSEYLNRFMWGRRAEVELEEAQLGKTKGVVAGRVKWWTGATHQRRLAYDLSESSLSLLDKWDGDTVPVLNFTIAPEIRVELLDDRTVGLVGTHATLRIECGQGRFKLQNMAFSRRCYEQVSTHRLRLELAGKQGVANTRMAWQWSQ